MLAETSDFSAFPFKSGPELGVASGLSRPVLKVKGEGCRVFPCRSWVQGLLCLGYHSLASGNLVVPWSILSSLSPAKGQSHDFRVRL